MVVRVCSSFPEARANSTVVVPSPIQPRKESSKGWGFLDQHVLSLPVARLCSFCVYLVSGYNYVL